MTFPDVQLDERDFQSLVNEARGRVSRQCPEWTEQNVSDPGVTLIETFAWMTEMLVYRLNRVPERMHVELLKLLGIELEPRAAACADVRFMAAAPVEKPITIPADDTEVATVAANGDEPVVFHVSKTFTIEPVALSAVVAQHDGPIDPVPVVARGEAYATAPGWLVFSPRPKLGDAFYLGFDKALDRLVLRVEFEGARAHGVGVDPDAAPLRWEVSQQGSRWGPAKVISDATLGLNKLPGAIELQMPERSSRAKLGSHNAYWLRCRVDKLSSAGLPSAGYVASPRIRWIKAASIGASVRTEHAEIVKDELLGVSNGAPGQTFTLRHTPALDMRGDERLEVREPGAEEPVPWQRRDSFDKSDRDDRHYRFDPAAGEIELGPAIRVYRKAWKQYGAVPRKGAELRMTRYRYGGGARGSLPAGALTELRTPIAGIKGVTNPRPSEGAAEAESIDAARLRAPAEFRTHDRAVTTEDFEFLAGEASGAIARVHCGTPAPHEPIPVYVVERPVKPEKRQLTRAELEPDAELRGHVSSYLDERRIVGMRVNVLPAPLCAVTVVVDAVIDDAARSAVASQRIREALYRFINPIVGGSRHGEGEGWPFGGALHEGELYGVVHDVPGVLGVKLLSIYETDLDKPMEPRSGPVDKVLRIKPNEVLCSAVHRVRVAHA